MRFFKFIFSFINALQLSLTSYLDLKKLNNDTFLLIFRKEIFDNL